MIKFDAKTQVVISNDLNDDLWRLLTEEGTTHAAIFVDSNIASQNIINDLIKHLGSKIMTSVYPIIAKEPTTEMVNELTPRLRNEKIDMFIGIGGGSVIDLTKALSVMAVNSGEIEDYHGTGKPFISGIKKIMVPTTAGTGSEVTPGAVLLNKATKFKRAISGSFIYPDYAVLNAGLTMTMPDSVIASTGMDALGHSIESYTAKCANDITRMYSMRAFALIYNNLAGIFKDRNNLILRQKVLLGSCLAGYAIYNSNTGAAHAMSYALGIYKDVPHGIAVANLLPNVVNINIEKGCTLYADLYGLIDGAKSMDSREERTAAFGNLLKKYDPLYRIGKRLGDFDINKNNYEFLAARGLDLISALSNNPVKFGIDDAKNTLKALI